MGQGAGYGSEAWDFLRRLATGLANREVGSVEPSELRELALAHGMSGLVAWQQESGALELDAELAASVRADWLSLRRRAAMMDIELAGLLRRCQHLSPPILLKGASIARFYQHPPARTWSDIDLLVPADQLDGWIGALQAAGYSASHTVAFDKRFLHAVEMARGEGMLRMEVDLHFRWWVESRVDRLRYERLVFVSQQRGDVPVLEMAPEATLLHSAVHLIHHGREARRFISYRDLFEMRELIPAARELARQVDLEWALEAAWEEFLNAKENRANGEPRAPWQKLVPSGRSSVRHHVARIREAGLRRGPMYLATLLQPGRLLKKWRRERSSQSGSFRFRSD